MLDIRETLRNILWSSKQLFGEFLGQTKYLVCVAEKFLKLRDAVWFGGWVNVYVPFHFAEPIESN